MSAATKKIVLTVITQINFLVYRVSDIIDLKLIEDNQFSANLTKFSPLQTFRIVKKLLASTLQHKMTKIHVRPLPFNRDPFSDITFMMLPGSDDVLLPSKLIGDEVRLQQIIVNLAKYAIKSTNSNEILLYVSYDQDSTTFCLHLLQNKHSMET